MHSRTPYGVGTNHGHFDTLDSPRLGLRGSHHLPPYSILYVRPWRLHPNGFLSQDSQSGVLKLSQFGLPRLWVTITSRPNLRSRRGLNQSCSFASLTPGPSFAHNLGFRCPNGSCEAILDIYTSRPFQRHQEHSNAKGFGPYNRALNFWESRRTPTSHFW